MNFFNDLKNFANEKQKFLQKENLIKVFDDTLDSIDKDKNLQSSLINTIKNQVVHLSDEKIELKKGDKAGKIIVSKKRSLEAAKPYTSKGKTGVLNFADFYTPGGLVWNGINTQEECLCRCSTLYNAISSLYDTYYQNHKDLQNIDYDKNFLKNQFYNDDCIYSPDIIVFKTDTLIPKSMSKKHWYKVDIISCAAPFLYIKNTSNINSHLYKVFYKRFKKIMAVAVKHNIKYLILGAFGCGDFLNPPEIVARAVKDVLINYKNNFEVIEFAIYCSPGNHKNYDIFKKMLDIF